jgi:2-polyprenyl-3-methyl-5-hydroxy-6-metoxy-1,4-benzoquinol methylase
VLDFGCGAGTLVSILRRHGREADGIEVDRPAIRAALCPDAQGFVRLYDGTLPLPYPDGRFNSAIAVEVLEHVRDHDAVLAELCRVAPARLVVTVPDMSAIPLSHHNNTVPWHLLESTHLNFFTQSSLSLALLRHYAAVEVARIAPAVTNDSKWYTSLMAFASNHT